MLRMVAVSPEGANGMRDSRSVWDDGEVPQAEPKTPYSPVWCQRAAQWDRHVLDLQPADFLSI